MEELGVKPNIAIVSMVGKVFVKLGMTDKYEKLMKKYPPPQWEFRYVKGKRIKVKAKQLNELSEGEGEGLSSDEEKTDNEIESKSEMLSDKEANQDGEDLSEEEEEEKELLGTSSQGTSREPCLDHLDSS